MLQPLQRSLARRGDQHLDCFLVSVLSDMLDDRIEQVLVLLAALHREVMPRAPAKLDDAQHAIGCGMRRRIEGGKVE